jgi:hypothetical protein
VYDVGVYIQQPLRVQATAKYCALFIRAAHTERTKLLFLLSIKLLCALTFPLARFVCARFVELMLGLLSGNLYTHFFCKEIQCHQQKSVVIKSIKMWIAR